MELSQMAAFFTPETSTGDNPANCVLRTTFAVGRQYRCTIVLDYAGIAIPGSTGAFRVQWPPTLSRRLTKTEMRRYRAGRDALLAKAAEMTGAKIALVEV
jgi:hypothetical protein